VLQVLSERAMRQGGLALEAVAHLVRDLGGPHRGAQGGQARLAFAAEDLVSWREETSAWDRIEGG
jgi:hypothetical protein